ncbi:MAG TPA: SPFH domain-containing protein, partial [Candidatus Saccharimonadales bacterium]|nr:SPFH domain-containing protein [Candidatus Saccharimonadales bacterium]
MKRSPLTIVVAAILILIFGLLLFVYQVRKSEVAVVTLFGKIHAVKSDPGPGLRWPWPIENVYKLDQRVQDLEGKFEQIKL